MFLMDGRLVLEYSQTGMDLSRVSTSATYSGGQWYNLMVDVSQQGARLSVNDTEVVSMGAPTIMPGAFNSSNYLFIGGLSPLVEGVVNTMRPSLPGCVRDVAINNQLLDLGQNMDSHLEVLGGCPAQVSPALFWG